LEGRRSDGPYSIARRMMGVVAAMSYLVVLGVREVVASYSRCKLMVNLPRVADGVDAGT